MANEVYNKNHAASIDYVNTAIVDAWDKMKIWMETNVDKLDYVQRIFTKLRECYRVDTGATSAYEYAELIYDSVIRMADALRSAGAIISDDTSLYEFADLIRQVSSQGFEICILGESGKHYTATEWEEYTKLNGTSPEAHAVVAVITPYQSFVIGTQDPSGYKQYAWGNSTDNVLGLYTNQTGSFVNVLQNSLNFKSLENTYRMLLWFNPEVLSHIDYDASDPDKNYSEYACVRFSTHEEMLNSGIYLMYDQQVYIVTLDDDGSENVSYYWEGSKYVKRFTVPRVANNITGSPAAEHAWQYKSWVGEQRQYTLPTINHLLMMYVYYTDINTCLSVLNRTTLPSSNSWSCQQTLATYAYYVVPSTGNVTNSNKTSTSAVVPVAAL
jgi:hypothetical protein